MDNSGRGALDINMSFVVNHNDSSPAQKSSGLYFASAALARPRKEKTTSNLPLEQALGRLTLSGAQDGDARRLLLHTTLSPLVWHYLWYPDEPTFDSGKTLSGYLEFDNDNNNDPYLIDMQYDVFMTSLLSLISNPGNGIVRPGVRMESATVPYIITWDEDKLPGIAKHNAVVPFQQFVEDVERNEARFFAAANRAIKPLTRKRQPANSVLMHICSNNGHPVSFEKKTLKNGTVKRALRSKGGSYGHHMIAVFDKQAGRIEYFDSIGSSALPDVVGVATAAEKEDFLQGMHFGDTDIVFAWLQKLAEAHAILFPRGAVYVQEHHGDLQLQGPIDSTCQNWTAAYACARAGGLSAEEFMDVNHHLALRAIAAYNPERFTENMSKKEFDKLRKDVCGVPRTWEVPTRWSLEPYKMLQAQQLDMRRYFVDMFDKGKTKFSIGVKAGNLYDEVYESLVRMQFSCDKSVQKQGVETRNKTTWYCDCHPVEAITLECKSGSLIRCPVFPDSEKGARVRHPCDVFTDVLNDYRASPAARDPPLSNFRPGAPYARDFYAAMDYLKKL